MRRKAFTPGECSHFTAVYLDPRVMSWCHAVEPWKTLVRDIQEEAGADGYFLFSTQRKRRRFKVWCAETGQDFDGWYERLLASCPDEKSRDWVEINWFPWGMRACLWVRLLTRWSKGDFREEKEEAEWDGVPPPGEDNLRWYALKKLPEFLEELKNRPRVI